eukprot:4149721-Amphidinium_carterae.2
MEPSDSHTNPSTKDNGHRTINSNATMAKKKVPVSNGIKDGTTTTTTTTQKLTKTKVSHDHKFSTLLTIPNTGNMDGTTTTTQGLAITK